VPNFDYRKKLNFYLFILLLNGTECEPDTMNDHKSDLFRHKIYKYADIVLEYAEESSMARRKNYLLRKIPAFGKHQGNFLKIRSLKLYRDMISGDLD
jgi:hypothetical protein